MSGEPLSRLIPVQSHNHNCGLFFGHSMLPGILYNVKEGVQQKGYEI